MPPHCRVLECAGGLAVLAFAPTVTARATSRVEGAELQSAKQEGEGHDVPELMLVREAAELCVLAASMLQRGVWTGVTSDALPLQLQFGLLGSPGQLEMSLRLSRSASQSAPGRPPPSMPLVPPPPSPPGPSPIRTAVATPCRGCCSPRWPASLARSIVKHRQGAVTSRDSADISTCFKAPLSLTRAPPPLLRLSPPGWSFESIAGARIASGPAYSGAEAESLSGDKGTPLGAVASLGRLGCAKVRRRTASKLIV